MSNLRLTESGPGGSVEQRNRGDGDRVLNEDGLRYEDEFVKQQDSRCHRRLVSTWAKAWWGASAGNKSGHGIEQQAVRALLANKGSLGSGYLLTDAGTAPISFMRPAAAV